MWKHAETHYTTLNIDYTDSLATIKNTTTLIMLNTTPLTTWTSLKQSKTITLITLKILEQ